MGTILSLKRRFESLDTGQIASNSVAQTTDKLMEINNKQLLDGINKFGQDIAPSYFNDPYFKSPESARRYSEWKDRISPFSKRRSGVPNLFIDGTYHKSRSARVEGDRIIYQSTSPKAQSISEKFDGLFGLATPYKPEYIKILRPVFISVIRKETGL
jgi:hypothetical protein